MATRFVTHVQTGTHAARPGAGTVPQGTLYSCSTHGVIYQSDGTSVWTEPWFSASGAGSAAYGSNANDVGTASAGGAATSNSRSDHVHRGLSAVSVSSNTLYGPITLTAQGTIGLTTVSPGTIQINATGGGSGSGNYTSSVVWTSGTSMPGSPATNQRITRTDLGIDFYYNGTRWLSTTLYKEPIGSQDQLNPFATNTTMARSSTWFNSFDLWIVTYYAFTYVATTNTGSAFWTVDLKRGLAANTIATFTTAADTVNLHTGHLVAVGALLGTSEVEMEVVITKTSTPGSIYVAAGISYRLVGV